METAAAPELVPWFSIWRRPRSTLQWILAQDGEAWVLGLAAISGIAEALDRASSRSMGDDTSHSLILFAVLIGGPLGGVIGLYVSAFLLGYSGRWLDGCASYAEVRAALAAPGLISAWGLLLWVPLLVFVGDELFTTLTPRLDGSTALQALFIGSGVVSIVMGLWAIVVTILCLSEVQRFSAWRAIANCFVAFVAVVLPILVVVLLWMLVR